jgi:hypothetical protein
MNRILQNFKMFLVLVSFASAGIFLSSCGDDEKPDTVPVVTTGAATDVTGTSAELSGEITDDGGLELLASGFVYSSTNVTPTLEDDFIEATPVDDQLVAMVEGLTSSTTYHVRAFASNQKGTGYGEVDFTTGNEAPVAENVSISGTAEVNKQLTATYTYSDSDDDAEGVTTLQWYAATESNGTGEAAIAGATEATFTVQEAQQGKYIRVGVTPKALTGTTPGTEVKSGFVGAIGEATTVTFTYNGVEVTYGILISAATGKKWLDRNLGAPNAATSATDFANYGDLFQWGRLADGHQLITRSGAADANMSGVNGTTTTLSTTNTPVNSLFIVSNDFPSYWQNPQNDNLWQGVSGVNNPCPTGWRIATQAEWAAENLGTLTAAYTKLKITLTGLRAGDNGNFYQSATIGQYWTSTMWEDSGFTFPVQAVVNSTSTTVDGDYTGHANGNACRCIKN